MRKAGFPAEILKQRNLGNACFIFFVAGVLIFSVIAVMYKPADPWMEPSSAGTAKVFSAFKKSTYKPDDTVLKTGEDFNTTDASVLEASAEKAMQALMPIITEEEIEKVEVGSQKVECDSAVAPQVNCSDPSVLAAIVRFNLAQSPNLNFYEYRAPVNGLNKSECDVAWKFRSKREKSWRMYRDFRRFHLLYDEKCVLKVEKREGWHSGKNAFIKQKKLSGGSTGGLKPKSKPERSVVPILELNRTSFEEVDIIDDSVQSSSLSSPSPDSFRSKKYLYYTNGGDRCKSMQHFLWSFLCGLGEAQYLNRTFVIDLSFCLSGANNPGHGDDYGKDLRLYFDYAHLKEAASVIELNEFLNEWKAWEQKQHSEKKRKAAVLEIADYQTTPLQIKDSDNTVIKRSFDRPEPDNYWYRVCEGETENIIQRPWHLLWKSKRIMDVVNAICGKMEWDFDAVHLIRGEKAANKELWPNLDADTSPDTLLSKLKTLLEPQRYVYLSVPANETNMYYDTVNGNFRIVTIDTFRDLWAVDSAWYKETAELMGGRNVEFDGYMRAEVDTEVMYRAKKRIETFNDLTSDCQNGKNMC